MPKLFELLSIRDVEIRNRIWLAPMCQYSCVAEDGMPTDWHLVHLGSKATGGFGLVLTEATAVTPDGRISPQDTGLWNEHQLDAWRRIVDFLHSQSAVAGIQLAHAGRKASTYAPVADGHGSVPVSEDGWPRVAPSPVAFTGYEIPRELTVEDIASIVQAFADAAARADRAGFDVVELHAAHGYLLHQFLSPLSNTRTDQYGGTYENRTRLVIEVVDAVRTVWPDDKALFVRFSATDWADGDGRWRRRST